MKKTIAPSYGGMVSQVGHLRVNRLLPNPYSSSVGPFVFLDHLFPTYQEPKTPKAPTGEFAHPHRGIATFSYLFSGELEHYDSRGHHGIVKAGGAQWMKAGNGIIHDENPGLDFQQKGGLLHALQFWINLPAKNKAEQPEYLALQAEGIPELSLPDGAGILRVVIGEYEGITSPVKTFGPQFIYHVRLSPGGTFEFIPNRDFEFAILVPTEPVAIDSTTEKNSRLVGFDTDSQPVELANPGEKPADVILFGGIPYTEPIVAEGPFVMNSRLEIADAYRDFFEGKYGVIGY